MNALEVSEQHVCIIQGADIGERSSEKDGGLFSEIFSTSKKTLMFTNHTLIDVKPFGWTHELKYPPIFQDQLPNSLFYKTLVVYAVFIQEERWGYRWEITTAFGKYGFHVWKNSSNPLLIDMHGDDEWVLFNVQYNETYKNFNTTGWSHAIPLHSCCHQLLEMATEACEKFQPELEAHQQVLDAEILPDDFFGAE